MLDTIEAKVMDFFRSPLYNGEHRKILYIYNKEGSHLESVEDLEIREGLFKVISVTDHNYFHSKFQVEKVYPNENIFLYFLMDHTEIQGNPMLDILLYSEELRLDNNSLLFGELGIGQKDTDLMKLTMEYTNFFKSKERTKKFKNIFNQSFIRNRETMEFSILATLTKVNQSDWISVMIALFEENAVQETIRWENIEKFGNGDNFWLIADELFGYNPATSLTSVLSIHTMLLQVFLTNMSMEMDKEFPLVLKKYILPKKNHIIIFINQWMNLKDQQQSYMTVSKLVESELGIQEMGLHFQLDILEQADTFRIFDEYIIQQITDQMLK